MNTSAEGRVPGPATGVHLRDPGRNLIELGDRPGRRTATGEACRAVRSRSGPSR